ncbi:hypothetical protein HCU64_06480 [Methylobacterium sp. C25]|uniref:hypothetical protein n=1 Tax=Methylobacterium sp. C25 TaxID=2721622 RepID=UPI001F2A067D|nr:hypothetical protein [Methylobacterium sp. C25]MCE4223392.1 hypothetical protein [Methylobacterium sp. C25]
MRLLLFAAAMLLSGAAPQAQVLDQFQAAKPVDPANVINLPIYNGTQPALNGYVQTYVVPTSGVTFVGDGIGNRQYISIDQFASAQQLRDQQARQDQFAFFMRRDFDRLSQGIALASALTVMPPNPGDRFAVTVSGAGFDGRGAGSISGTYRVREDILVFGGYARSETQNLVKGGATFSFR